MSLEKSIFLRYALAPVCVAVAVLLHLSAIGPFLHPTGLFLVGIVAAAWFGGAGPGFLAAVLATFALPQLIPMSYPLVAGFFDLPRFVTFAVTGLAVGWGTTFRRRAEAALRQSGISEERYAVATTASEEGFWDWDVPSDDFYASPRMLEMYGFAPGTVFAGREDFLARFPFHPEDRPKWQEAVAAHFAGRTARFDIEIRMLRDSETRWLHLTGLATRDDAGKVARWTGAAKDVTARKRTEALLAGEKQVLELIARGDPQKAVLDVICRVFDDLMPALRSSVTVLDGRSQHLRLAAAPHLPAAFAERMAALPLEGPESGLCGLAVRRAEPVFAPDLAADPAWASFHEVYAAHGLVACWSVPFMSKEGRPLGTFAVFSGQSRGPSAHELAIIEQFGHLASIAIERKRTEGELKRSEERYALAMQASGEGHWDWKIGTDEYYTSPRHLEILGLPPGTTSKGRAEALARIPYHPEDRAKYDAAVAAHFAGETPRVDIQLRLLVRGELRWVHAIGMCLRNAAGVPVRWAGSMTDITEQKRAEEALRLSEERYARAMEASDDGLWEWYPATDAMFLSARARELFGIADGTQIRTRADVKAHGGFHPDDVPRIEAAIQASRAPESGGLDIEYRVVSRSGEERWIRSRGKVFLDEQGRPALLTGALTDITERKRGELALRLSEERYALAMQASGEGHWDWKIPSDEFYASPRWREIAGFAADETFKGRADALARYPFHPDDRPKYEAALAAYFAGTTKRFEIELRIRPRGELRWAKFIAICLRDANGTPVRLTGSISDITEKKNAEEALRESEKRYERAMLASEAGYWDWDVSTDEFYVSPKLLEIGGFPAGTKFAGRADFMRRAPFHPDDWANWEGAVRELFAGTKSRLAMEVRVVVAGETRWHNLNGICFRDAAGKVVRWSGSSTDVTARKRAQESLRLSEERYALAMLAAEDAHWDWIVGTDQYYLSPRTLDLFGLPPDTIFTSREDYLARTPLLREDLEKWQRAMGELFAGTGSRLSMEVRAIVRGETRWIQHIGVCVRDAAGRPVRWCGTARDITERKRTEEALRLSEERYARAMEGSDAGHWDWNIVTDEMFVSPSAREMLALPAGTLPARRSEIMALVPQHPDDREGMDERVNSGIRSGTHERDYRVIPRSGEVRWLRSRGKVYNDARGAAVRMTGSLTDITERKLAADVLRASEARFRGLTELSSDWYWKQDENLRFSYMSNQAVDLGALPAPSPIGKTRWELPYLTPLSCSWAEHQAVLAARQPFRDFELSRVMPDGSVGYFSVSGAPLFDEHGRFQGYHGTGRSITERKRIEEELRSRQEMLDLAQKSARATAFEWRIGASGEGQNRWSPDLEAMYGLAPGTYDGSFETWKKLVHPDDWPAVKDAVKHAQRTGDVAAEYRVVHPNGSVHWLNAKGRMFFDHDGKPVRMVGFMHDVTERRQAEEGLKRMERQLRQSQRLEAMGTLAGGIAHDFNNILGAILGYGEMALRDAAKGSRLRRDLDSIVTAGERGRALVDRVLAFSRSGVGERVAVHVEKVAREALDLLSAKLPSNVTLHAKLHAGTAAMLGDATQVHQVLMNLATNGIQAMPSGGTLRVSLDTVRLDAARVPTIGTLAAADYLVLKVADSGSGIAPEIIERIFDPFFTTKEIGTGTGLGLSLVHGIVTEIGGAIDVASMPGKGSTFTVYLPRSGDATDLSESEAAAMPRGAGQRVLIVDDEEPLVQLATRTLEELGYVPTGFTSSAAALAAFRADPQRFDALITDERMPGMSGSALIREVRGIRDSIPVVLMSGYLGAMANDARESPLLDALGVVPRMAVAVGANEVLKKPLSARELATSLARVLHS